MNYSSWPKKEGMMWKVEDTMKNKVNAAAKQKKCQATRRSHHSWLLAAHCTNLSTKQ
jgi:hypothetical protein